MKKRSKHRKCVAGDNELCHTKEIYDVDIMGVYVKKEVKDNSFDKRND